MKNHINNCGTSLIETIVGFAIISIVSVTIVSGFNVFSNLILDSNQKKNNLSDLFSAVNDYELNENNIAIEESFDSIEFILNDEKLSLPIKFKTYSIKTQPEKKIITFTKYQESDEIEK